MSPVESAMCTLLCVCGLGGLPRLVHSLSLLLKRATRSFMNKPDIYATTRFGVCVCVCSASIIGTSRTHTHRQPWSKQAPLPRTIAEHRRVTDKPVQQQPSSKRSNARYARSVSLCMPTQFHRHDGLTYMFHLALRSRRLTTRLLCRHNEL